MRRSSAKTDGVLRRGVASSLKRPLALVFIGLVVAGCPQVVLDLDPQPDAAGVHWLRLGIISDVHILDEESPARIVRLDDLVAPAWRPQGGYAVQVLDATVQMLNALHRGGAAEGRPIDLVLVTGDSTDNAQYNELRWFINTMDGGWVLPDSGALDGELRDVAPEDNPKLAYLAAGLDKDIPWYAVYGNHDALAAGCFPIDRTAWDPGRWSAPLLWPLAERLGLHAISPALNSLRPTLGHSPAIIRASEERIDPDTLQLLLDELDAGPIEPDPDRRFLSKESFIEELFNTRTEPVGHGYDENSLAMGTAWYSIRPKEDVPVRLVVMDTVAPDPPDRIAVEYGVMTREQFDTFVKPEVEAAWAAGEYVILVSHHPSAHFDKPYPNQSVKTSEFRRYMTRRPNIVAHLAGHEHRHHVTTIWGLYPYLEIETGPLIDYPQEGRILDVFYDEETETLRLESTIFGHMENPTRLSGESYRRATIDVTQRKAAASDALEADLEALFSDPKNGEDSQNVARFTGWAPARSPQDRYGRAEDRNFTATLHRPDIR